MGLYHLRETLNCFSPYNSGGGADYSPSSPQFKMHRQPEHVMNFLLGEMGTSGSLDGQQRLVVKGRFAPKKFEGILRRYANEYVICTGCKSPDTILSKENRLFFLRCEQCGSSRSVAPIKAGFVARVGRRKAGT